MTTSLPTTHRALSLPSIGADLILTHPPTPQPGPGSVVVRILTATILSYHAEIHSGARKYSLPTPLVPGGSAIGRIAAIGPDATILTPGQLVYVDCVMRARDDPGSIFLSAINEGGTPGSKKLMREVWRDGTFAEYAWVPVENCVVIDEERVCGVLGYKVRDLGYLSNLLVPFGGLRDIGVEAGQTVVVAPATGAFGAAGVIVAATMGARVIAMGRREEALLEVKERVLKGLPRAMIEIMKISGDETRDTEALCAFGTIDAVLDLTPPEAASATYLRSAIAALKYKGRVSVMGFPDITSSPAIRWRLVGNDITIKGKLMYSKDDMLQMMKMLERGLLPSAQHFCNTKAYALEEWKQAMEDTAKWTGAGKLVVFEP